MATKSTTKTTTTKKKKKKPYESSPVIGNNGLELEPGDNTMFLTMNLEILNLPKINMENVDEVQERLNEYFRIHAKYDCKPTVSAMAIALNGHNRQWLYCITHDKPLGGRGNYTTLPKTVTNVIKKCYFMLETLWENYMTSGKINPVAGIFLGKNNYGYQDKVEHVLTPNTDPVEEYDADDIKDRYLSDSASDSEKE